MSRRSSRYNASLKGLGLAIAALAALGLALAIWSWGTRARMLQQLAYPIPSPEYENAQPYDQKSLQAQARQAATADTALVVSLGQLVLSVLGIAGVGFTVLYARLAWREAQRSADAAHLAVEETRSTAKRQLRAYVHINDASLYWTADGAPFVLLACVNTGQTPAKFFEIGSVAEIVEMGSDAHRRVPIGLAYTIWSALGGGQSLSVMTAPEPIGDVTKRRLSKLPNGRLSVRGRVRYSDIFNEIHESEFTFFRRTEELDRLDDEKKPIRKMSSAPAKLTVYEPTTDGDNDGPS